LHDAKIHLHLLSSEFLDDLSSDYHHIFTETSNNDTHIFKKDTHSGWFKTSTTETCLYTITVLEFQETPVSFDNKKLCLIDKHTQTQHQLHNSLHLMNSRVPSNDSLLFIEELHKKFQAPRESQH
jgi:hypothetical protein